MRSASPSFELNCPGKDWTGDNMGRPPRYDDPVKMEQAIEEYFSKMGWVVARDDLGAIVTDGAGKPVIMHNIPTMAGLAYHLGFVSRQSIHDYEKQEAFSYLIKRARLRIEAFIENDLLTTKSPTGPIFWLKNHAGYRDSHEVTGDSTKPISIRVSFE